MPWNALDRTCAVLNRSNWFSLAHNRKHERFDHLSFPEPSLLLSSGTVKALGTRLKIFGQTLVIYGQTLVIQGVAPVSLYKKVS